MIHSHGLLVDLFHNLHISTLITKPVNVFFLVVLCELRTHRHTADTRGPIRWMTRSEKILRGGKAFSVTELKWHKFGIWKNLFYYTYWGNENLERLSKIDVRSECILWLLFNLKMIDYEVLVCLKGGEILNNKVNQHFSLVSLSVVVLLWEDSGWSWIIGCTRRVLKGRGAALISPPQNMRQATGCLSSYSTFDCHWDPSGRPSP